MKSLITAAFLSCTLANATAAPAPSIPAYDGKCGAPVKSPEDAMAKADFIVEGTVSDTMYFKELGPTMHVVIENRKLIRELMPTNKKIISMTVVMGPCLAQGALPFTAKGSASVVGKRMRFFGNEHASNRYRFFYMQPASAPMPAALDGWPWGVSSAASKVHGSDIEKPIGDGWHRAGSTGGRFAVDLPAPYLDATEVVDGVPRYSLRTVDKPGSMFSVVFEPSRKGSMAADLFDSEMGLPDAVKSVFRGMPAVHLRNRKDPVSGMVMNGMMVRVPGGTYALAMVTRKNTGRESVKDRERFFNSIAFE